LAHFVPTFFDVTLPLEGTIYVGSQEPRKTGGHQMLKVKFICWPADDLNFKIKSSLTADEAEQIEVMTRP